MEAVRWFESNDGVDGGSASDGNDDVHGNGDQWRLPDDGDGTCGGRIIGNGGCKPKPCGQCMCGCSGNVKGERFCELCLESEYGLKYERWLTSGGSSERNDDLYGGRDERERLHEQYAGNGEYRCERGECECGCDEPLR